MSTERRAYRPAELADVLEVAESTIHAWLRDGKIPRPPNHQPRSAVIIPAWRVDSYLATGDWDHPDWRPVPRHLTRPNPDDGEQIRLV